MMKLFDASLFVGT